MKLTERAPVSLARFIGQAIAPRVRLVHRFDLRLPPRFGLEIATAHDLPPFRFDDEGGLPAWFVAGNRSLAGIIVPSNFAADEVRDLLGVRRVWVIPYGLAPEFASPVLGDASLRAQLGIDRPYVIHAAGATKRKNLKSLAEAWRIINRDDLQLVLCGPPDYRRTSLFSELKGVVLAGKVSSLQMSSLMSEAQVVVVPSTYEGFGLPALEGMACGAVVVAANAGALPEVCADAAVMVDPTPEGIAEGIDRALNDTELQRRLKEAGPIRASTFSWDKAAAGYFDVYEELLS